MDPWYPSLCPFCRAPVEMRQLVGGGWDKFEVNNAIKYHRCPHPTELYRNRQKPAQQRVAVTPTPEPDVGRPLPNQRLPSHTVHPLRPVHRPPAPTSIKARSAHGEAPDYAEPGIDTAHPADSAGIADRGTCAMCGATIAAASLQDLCASCLSQG